MSISQSYILGHISPADAQWERVLWPNKVCWASLFPREPRAYTRQPAVSPHLPNSSDQACNTFEHPNSTLGICSLCDSCVYFTFLVSMDRICGWVEVSRREEKATLLCKWVYISVKSSYLWRPYLTSRVLEKSPQGSSSEPPHLLPSLKDLPEQWGRGLSWSTGFPEECLNSPELTCFNDLEVRPALDSFKVIILWLQDSLWSSQKKAWFKCIENLSRNRQVTLCINCSAFWKSLQY